MDKQVRSQSDFKVKQLIEALLSHDYEAILSFNDLEMNTLTLLPHYDRETQRFAIPYEVAKGFIPKGYLWHFDANVLGNVALVREELLLGVKHTKGYKLWEKFLQTQN
ncbi:HNH endonuclease [Helicobacter pylori]|uniref:HNH endonuclease signature motif containing protein n=1 Tax=Helicobacter pylori TaxID=210 RepID=UPI002928BD41|nr:HNH endonuclease [Helicobacter pylori]MDU9765206.1 HNH endonuclease [Helicobacter pylori]